MKRTLYTILICMLTWKVSADTDKLLSFMVDGVIDTTNYETAGLTPTPGIKTVTIFKAGDLPPRHYEGRYKTLGYSYPKAVIQDWSVKND